MEKLRIGTLVRANKSLEIIPQILDYGFESFALTFWESVNDLNLERLAGKLDEVLEHKDVKISCLSIYGNPLVDKEAVRSWEELINNANFFGTDLVTGFAGRLPNKPVNESIPRFKEVFGDLARRAEEKNVRLAFENCKMGGDWEKGEWNIAHGPKAWKLMFEAIPKDNLGLEWEPAHQLLSLVDPIPQLREWAGKIFHVHGKDATVAWDIIERRGIDGPEEYAWHRTPGFGDTNWTDIITILRKNGYSGTIDRRSSRSCL